MKNVLKILIMIFVCLISINTYAMQYKTVEIFTSSEKATVATDMFLYTDFIYVPAVKGSRYGTIEFESITNKTDKILPVSINLLMFDKNKKNIGFLTYCSTKDISSDYSQMQIKANATSPFSITVSDTYFVEGYTADDIYYLAVLDENKYCQIGGYEKYKGLTIEQISDGIVASNLDENGEVKFSFSEFFNKLNLGNILSSIIISIVSLFVIGIILNMLSKRIFANASIMAYLPLTNCFIAVMCCFGKKLSYVFLLLIIIAVPLYFVTFIGKVLLYMLFFISAIAFFIDIYKLITKKYEFCFYEPLVENNISNKTITLNNVNNNSNSNSNSNSNNVNEPSNFIKDDTINTGNEIIDLSFSSPNPKDDNLFSNDDNNTYGEVANKENHNNKEGESDLSKFFR